MLVFQYGWWRRVAVMLLAWSLAGGAVAAQGYIEKAGTRMPVADSVAVMDEQLNRLVIYLLPTRLTDDEKRRIGRGSALMVLMNKGSPDSGKWDWYPYATLELKHREPRFDSADNLYGYALMTYGIQHRNRTNTINGYFADQTGLQDYRFSGERIRFRFADRREGVETHWDLDVNAQIIERENNDD
ncbi:MAG: hypothetical protein ACLFQT_06690 [Thiohalophilus sp.]